MSEQTSSRPGWYPDPSGRFPKRWYDGDDWTASVLDDDQLQSYDQLPPARVASAAIPPAPVRSPAPPPAPATAPPPAPAAPAARPAPTPAPSGDPWRPGQPWPSAQSQPAHLQPAQWPSAQSQPARSHPAQPFTPTTSGGVWAQQPVTAASLGLTPPRVVRVPVGAQTTPIVYGLVGVAVACMLLSMFVLDWYSEAGQSVGFRDFAEGSILSSAPFLDKLTFWHFEWLGLVVAAVVLLSVSAFVIARTGPHRAGHLVAATGAGGGALLSTFAIVRLFRTEAFHPAVGAWLLPAGYLVLLAAVVVSARNESG